MTIKQFARFPKVIVLDSLMDDYSKDGILAYASAFACLRREPTVVVVLCDSERQLTLPTVANNCIFFATYRNAAWLVAGSSAVGLTLAKLNAPQARRMMRYFSHSPDDPGLRLKSCVQALLDIAAGNMKSPVGERTLAWERRRLLEAAPQLVKVRWRREEADTLGGRSSRSVYRFLACLSHPVSRRCCDPSLFISPKHPPKRPGPGRTSPRPGRRRRRRRRLLSC